MRRLVRHEFFHEPSIRAAQATIALMQRFEEVFGVAIGFRQGGYLFPMSASTATASARERA